MSVTVRWKTLKNGDKSSYLDIYHNGERYSETLKIYLRTKDTKEDKREKKQMIDSIRAKRELALSANDYNYIPTYQKNVDFIKYYEAYLKNYSKKDVRKVRYSLEKFKIFTKGKKIPFKSVTPKICDDFRNFLISPESGLNGETPYDYWKRFKGVIKEAKREGIINKLPTEEIMFKGYQKYTNQLRKQVLTEDELKVLYKTYCGNEMVKRAFLFSCFTGLGMAEIRKFTWERVNNMKIRLFREKSGEQIINDLHPFAMKMIQEPQKSNELVFPGLPSDQAIRKNLKNWVKKAGIDKSISYYCARHTFACLLLLNGANLKTVADCMGHTSTRHTLKYLHYVNSLKTEAIGSLPDISL